MADRPIPSDFICLISQDQCSPYAPCRRRAPSRWHSLSNWRARRKLVSNSANKHVEGALARRRARIDWLLNRFERRTLGFYGTHDVLQITDAARQLINARDH
jgi:hypothetical protein